MDNNNTVTINMRELMELMTKAATLDAVITMVHRVPSYSLSDALKAFFPAPEQEQGQI